MEGELKVQDGSNDRKYFTIIPNYVLDHSTANTQALYLQLKRIAGENGVAFPGSRHLRGKLGISYNTLKKELANLIKNGWIVEGDKKEVNTDGGRQKVKSYKIVDIWGINNSHFCGGVKPETPTERGIKNVMKGVSTGSVKAGTKEEPTEEELFFKKTVFTLKDWNERQSSPIQFFKPENIIKKHGIEKVDRMIKQYGQMNGGFSRFLQALKKNNNDGGKN